MIWFCTGVGVVSLQPRCDPITLHTSPMGRVTVPHETPITRLAQRTTTSAGLERDDAPTRDRMGASTGSDQPRAAMASASFWMPTEL